MKKILAAVLLVSTMTLPLSAIAGDAPPPNADVKTGQGVILGGDMVGVTTMIWGFAGWASAESLAAATVGGAVFFGGLGILAAGSLCALSMERCGHALNVTADFVSAPVRRLVSTIEAIHDGPAASCPLK